MRGIRYYSMLDGSGYCMAAAALVRALVNTGVPVQWIPLLWQPGNRPPLRLDTHAALATPFVQANQTQQAWQDLPALLRATEAPVDADTVIVHTVPEFWPALREPGRRNIGHTVWETTRLPLHWVPLCNSMQGVIVPCEFNRAVFEQSGCRVPVMVLPHLRRTQWREFDAPGLAQCRKDWGIRDDAFTFYSINTWDIRKNMELMLSAFALAFAPDAPVQLVVKTGVQAYLPQPPYSKEPLPAYLDGLLQGLEQRLGRALPTMAFIADDFVPNDAIDALHQLGDCFVSLSHGEGWGLGAFDAATYGNPVTAPYWGGLRDYLPQGWSGAVPHHLEQVPIWPPHKPSYWSDQQWAGVQLPDAAGALQTAWRDAAARQQEALAIQARISDTFSEYRVAATLLEALQ